MILDVEFIENSKEINAEFESVIVAGGDPEASYNKGYDAGKQAEYAALWDSIQENGNRTNYSFCFAGEAWALDIFKPKYPIIPTSSQNMFAYWGNYGDRNMSVDFRGLPIDFSKTETTTSCFLNNLFIVAVGEISAISAASISTFFDGCRNLHTVEKVIVKEDGTTTLNNTFRYCESLENITFEGVIGKNVDFQYSPLLTLNSLKSIINALKDYSGTSAKFTCKLTLSSASKTLLENEGATAPNGTTWLEYAYSKGWNY